MAFYDNELNIVNEFIEVLPEEILIFDDNGEILLNSVCDNNNWINSSGKSDPPPDMYSNKYNLMMDIMRVDDHTSITKKGKMYNPHRIKENKTYKEIQQWIAKSDITLTGDNLVNTVTDLPTSEDHSYDKYLNEFSRVVKKHDESYNLYIENHPNMKLIYFILDESSPYLRSKEKNIIVKAGNKIRARLHLFFYDSSFINVLKESKADYVIWYAPFKHFDSLEKVELPKVIMYTKDNLNKMECIKYNQSEMYSIEE